LILGLKKCKSFSPSAPRPGESWHCAYLGTGKSPEPADKNVGATWRRLSSLRVQATRRPTFGFQSPVLPPTVRIIKNSLKLLPTATTVWNVTTGLRPAALQARWFCGLVVRGL